MHTVGTAIDLRITAPVLAACNIKLNQMQFRETHAVENVIKTLTTPDPSHLLSNTTKLDKGNHPLVKRRSD